jgi:hypothetical protein
MLKPTGIKPSTFMKKLKYIVPALLLTLSIAACNNNLDKVFDTATLVEFNDAILSTNATGRTYPIVSLTNSLTAGVTRTAQVNLVGPQKATDITVRVLVDAANTTAAASSYSVANGGNVVIPANTSFGSLTLVTSRFTSSTAPVGNVVFILDSTSTDFKPSFNYRRIGFSFRQ